MPPLAARFVMVVLGVGGAAAGSAGHAARALQTLTISTRPTLTGVEVTLSGPAPLRYTTDGTDPLDTANPSRRQYTAPFVVAQPGATLVTAAAGTGVIAKEVVNVPLRPPSVTPSSGNFTGFVDVTFVSSPGTSVYYLLVTPGVAASVSAEAVRASGFRASDAGLRLPPADASQSVAAVAEHQAQLSEVTVAAPFRVAAAKVTAPVLPGAIPSGDLSASLAQPVPPGTSLTVTPECPGVVFVPGQVVAGAGDTVTPTFRAVSGSAARPDCVRLALGGSAERFFVAPAASSAPPPAPLTAIDTTQAVAVVIAARLSSLSAGGVASTIATHMQVQPSLIQVVGLADAQHACGGAVGTSVAVLEFPRDAGTANRTSQRFVNLVSDSSSSLYRALPIADGQLPYTTPPALVCREYRAPSDSYTCTDDGLCIVLVLALGVTSASCLFLAVMVWSSKKIQADRKGYVIHSTADGQTTAPGTPRGRAPPGPDLCDPESWVATCGGREPVQEYQDADPPVNPVASVFPKPPPAA
eukprot:TRINITY_DN33360_c0_g1_i1.p1 TRINITY_DN33360_c0_g1~~TRINITY_DN33360_c0_g1_i1.p1  ORF type:complete len:526 (+),score=150.64 TRINITY_DN33360_c0_g1_i1:96-1673(+)